MATLSKLRYNVINTQLSKVFILTPFLLQIRSVSAEFFFLSINHTYCSIIMSIIVNSLSYIHPDGEILFNDINFSITTADKVSLVGRNGIGKSTMLRIITGNLKQSSGEIISSDKPYYIPQHLGEFDDLSVAEVLDISAKIEALHSILGGDVSLSNFDIIGDDWNIEERIKLALKYWNLENLDLSKKMASLSGGEKTKIFLSGILIHDPKIILLDEPSNHLDIESRILLYDFIKKSKSTILVVSHDIELLNIFSKTIELSKDSIEIYGGNYDFYDEQKDIKLNALQLQLADQERKLKNTQIKAREVKDQRLKQDIRGKKQKAKAGVPRIVMGGLKNNAEKSSSKINSVQDEKIKSIATDINALRLQVEMELPLKINLKSSILPKGKLLVDAKEINLMYPEKGLWKEPLSFQIYSGDRILIRGRNGAGKTSLMSIITEEKNPSTGNISVNKFKYLYLDQEYSLMRNDLTVFENIQIFNDLCLLEHDLKMLLHHHQFPREYWDRQCVNLSGGEKMKLLLCCLSVSNNIPDVLILDEPTNNLDIQSLKTLTDAIREFDGTILVISHDLYFVEKIGLSKVVEI